MVKLRAKCLKYRAALELKRLAGGWDATRKPKEKKKAAKGKKKKVQKKGKKQLSLKHSASATLLDAETKPSASLPPATSVDEAASGATANPVPRQSEGGPSSDKSNHG